MTKKILFIESASEMGGVEFSTLYLAANLDRQKWQSIVVCPREGMLASACREVNVEVRIIPIPDLIPTSVRINLADVRIPNPLAWIWNVILLTRSAQALHGFIMQSNPDIVITKGLPAHFFGGLAARIAKVRCIWHVQDFISERFGGLYKYFFGLAVSVLPDEIIVDGKSIAAQLPVMVQKKIFIVLNGVDVKIFRPCTDSGMVIRRELGIGAQQIVIGNAARITPWKGQHHLLEAFGKLADRHEDLRLLFVGAAIFDHDDYERYLHTRATELGLDGKVVFAGFRKDLPEVLNAMDIFVYPSVEKDTSPLALLSALACGLPVVAFDIDGVQEVLGTCGIMLPLRDEKQMATTLDELVLSIERRRQMKSESRAKALEKFSLVQYVQNMEYVFLREF